MYKKYEKKGQMGGVVGSIIALIVGVGVATLVLIFVGTLGGQTYQLTESKIDAITNTTIKRYIKDGVVSGFSALKQTADYMPLIVLAIIIALVLGLVLSMGGLGRGGGSAL